MKNYFILLFALVSFVGYSQISFGARHRGTPKALDQETLERFKSTTTIFVLSDVIENSEYDKILKDSWTVTPYKIVTWDDFSLVDMYQENYSFATLTGFKIVEKKFGMEVPKSLHTYFDIAMYEGDEIKEKLGALSSNLSEKKRKRKLKEIFKSNKKSIAKFYLFPDTDFVVTAFTKKNEEIMESIYNEDVFFNYSAGMLKNYFQKVNAIITAENTYWMYGKDFKNSKIGDLATSTLYIPEYITQKTNGWNANISDRDEKEIEKLFKGYKYEYEFISKDALDEAISANEEFYYLRYVRINSERFVQVVNSKTGDVIYKDYFPGFGSYNLKAKNLDHLSKVIAKSKKKLAK